MRTLALIVAACALAGAATAQDPAALFSQKCGNCHTVTDAESGPEGPSLKGVYGRQIASLSDYDYSTGLKAKAAGHWGSAELDAYLASPKAFAPGGSMFTTVPDPAMRAAIIGYLKGQK